MVTPQSVLKVYFWFSEKSRLSQSEIRALSNLSERAVRYALEFLKKENLVAERKNFADLRKKIYEVCQIRDSSISLQSSEVPK